MAFKFKLGQLVRVVNDMGREPNPISRIDSPATGSFRGFVTWPILEGRPLLVVARLPPSTPHAATMYVLMCGGEYYECSGGHLESMR